MRIVCVTRLRVRSIRFLPGLYWATRKLQKAIKKAPGFVMGKLLADRNLAFWTMSMWEDIDSMRAFRNGRAHAAIMPNAARWCDEASFVHWQTEADELPGWAEAHRRMNESGKLSPLRFPSADHKACKYKQPYDERFVIPLRK